MMKTQWINKNSDNLSRDAHRLLHAGEITYANGRQLLRVPHDQQFMVIEFAKNGTEQQLDAAINQWLAKPEGLRGLLADLHFLYDQADAWKGSMTPDEEEYVEECKNAYEKLAKFIEAMYR
jgi:hypothetical protein